MGLETFETEGPRTYSKAKSAQAELDQWGRKNFEKEHGAPLHKVSIDNEKLASFIRDSDSITEICDEFMWIEHTVVSKCVELVDEGLIDVDDVPEVDHPDYNEHSVSFYINQRLSNKTLGRDSTSDNTDDTDSGGALSAFKT